MSHTEGKWTVEITKDNGGNDMLYRNIQDENNNRIAEYLGEDNAKRIVQMNNSFNDLLSALHATTAAFKTFITEAQEPIVREISERSLIVVKQAITQAEAE